MLVFGTKTTCRWSIKQSREQYRKGSKQPIFLGSTDIFHGNLNRHFLEVFLNAKKKLTTAGAHGFVISLYNNLIKQMHTGFDR